MKKQIVMICILAVVLLTNGCNQKKGKLNYLKEIPEDKIMFEQQVEYSSFETSLKDCTDIIIATYVQEHIYDTYTEQEFQVKQVIKGATEASTIYLFEQPTDVIIEDSDIYYISGSYQYESGEDYMLVLEREVSVYYDHDRYVLLGEIYMPLSSLEVSMIYDTNASEHIETDMTKLNTESSLIQYVETILAAEPSQTREFVGSLYEESEELYDIVPASTHILQIKIDSLLIEGFDRETYRCKIQKSFKGEVSKMELEEGIFIPFFKSQIKVGEEYVVLLNKDREDTLVYTLSSRNSVFTTEDMEAIFAIEEVLNQQN